MTDEPPREPGSDVTEAFAGLPDDLAAWLTDELRTVRVGPREVIVRRGDAAEALFVVVDGEVEILSVDPDGTERRLRGLGPGQFFGEVGLLHDTPRNATVRAVGPVRLLRLPGRALRHIVEEVPLVAEALADLARRRGPNR